MTWTSDEGGFETSLPREGIEIDMGTVVYRVATGTRDVVIGGAKFTASPAGRDEITMTSAGDESELLVSLPATHPIPRRWMQLGVPPRQVLVTLYRLQETADAYKIIWRGVVTSLNMENHVARLHVSSRMGVSLQRRVATITAGRDCVHVLYDSNCTVSRVGASVVTTVTQVDGRAVTIAASLTVDQNVRFGELVHTDSGERMTVIDQIGKTCTLQLPIPGLKLGDTVEVFLGCDHSPSTCFTKFSNMANYGGFPQLPNKNPMLTTGFGVVTQE